MDSKQIFVSICLFIVFFSLLSVASASDTTDNVTVTAVSDDSNTISVTNNQDHILGADPDSFTDLNYTISQAGENVTLEKDYAYYSTDGGLSEGITIDRSIAIDGHGCTINAQNNASIFNIQGNSHVVLKNINFINANGTNGGAIRLDSSASLEIINCNFTNNTARIAGGAIYVDDSSSLTSNLNVTGSKFNNNSADYGGAIYWKGDHGSVIDSEFTYNFARIEGGAIYWEGNCGTVRGSRFESNNVSGVLNSSKTETRHNSNTGIDEVHKDLIGGDGGAIIWKGSDAVIEDSTFYKNYAPYRGGAIYFTGMEGENCTNVTIIEATFTENYAAMNGGAIDWASGASNATIVSSHFTKNVADRSAGAIYVRGNGLEIKDSDFQYNLITGKTLYDDRIDGMTFTSIGGNGGAICWMGSYGTVDNVLFKNNTATQRGGAIQFERNVNGTVKDSRFINNYAGTEGGAIDFYNGAENGKIINSVFTGNIAHENGGAIYWQGHYGTINASTFENNRALGLGDGASVSNTTNPNTNASEERFNITGGDGGAIKWTGSHGIITGSSFIKNSAAYNGGALYFVGNATENCTNITFEDCEFTQNNADLNGGALFWASGASNATLTDSKFTKNTAARTAGAIYINGNYLEIKDTEFRENDAARSQTYDNRSGSSYFTSLGGNAGAICWMGSYGTVDNGTFIKNTAADRGGAIQFERNQNGTVKNSYFEQNTAYGDGGAIDWYQGAVNGQLINSTFKANKIEGYDGSGAGVYIEGYNATIKDSRFYDHYTNSDGGALYVAGDDCKLYDSNFTGNTAGDDGGAIYWEGDNGYIYNIACVNNKGISVTKEDGVNTSSTRGGTLSLIGDNVTVEKSTFKSSRAAIDDGKDSSKVDGGAIFITGNDINVLECDFNDCQAVNSGGAIHIIGNDTCVLNCSVQNTKALVGGAIFIDGQNTTVDNSIFRKNQGTNNGGTAGSGGAIYVQGSDATISNSDFANGDAINYGGAISVWGANANITRNVFDICTTKLYDGGSIYVNGANATISLSNFTRSTAKNQFAHGGAIQVSGDNANVLDCNFRDCFAYYGGVIHISGSNALVDGSNFNHSVTYRPTNGDRYQYPQQGGAIYVNGTHTTIHQSNFTDITCEDEGGAIYVSGVNANISECGFVKTIVRAENGGAIYIAGKDANIEKSNFTECKADNSKGGAICINGENTVINASNFENCKAKDGGDIYVFGNHAKIEDSTFTSNTATNNGGAIYLDAWGASIKGSNITGCTAYHSGGGIYVAGGGTQISESNFESCQAKGDSAEYGGGSIYINGPDTHISDSSFNNSKVPSRAYGGTIYIKGERTIIDGSVFNASSAREGGIIYIEGEYAVIDSSVFANSSATNGGAISVHGNNSTIRGSDFENLRTGDTGGAIYVDGEDTDILYSSFDRCISTGASGGAIYIDDIKTTVAYSNFTSCKAKSAGAININGIYTQILYCNLDNNTASSAGAIKVFGNHTIISNSNFTNNNATYTDGGALDIGGTNASVYSCWFDHNDAVNNGGAINWKGGHGNDTILGSTFTNNGCHGTGQGGGAVYWTAGDDPDNIPAGGLILNCIFINNTAYGHHGGAIDWFYARDSTINNCLFVNNTAYGDGGALYTGDQNGHGHHLMMSNCQFYNNTAMKHGGAIANQMSDSWIYNNTFDRNKAIASGGTILMKETHADNSVIDHCYIFNSFVNQTYSGNSYGVGGGAIRIGHSGLIGDGNITISNCAIINSTTNKTWGGAILIDYGSRGSSLINVSIQNARILDGYGGAICWKGDGGYMNNVTIFNSSSTLVNDDKAYGSGEKSANGGAIYVAASNCNFTNITIFKSSTNNGNESSTKFNHGGAVYVSGSSNTISNIEIDESSASSVNMNANGGAIYWVGQKGTLVNATISNTLANGQGGAIYWSGNSPTVENISITYSRTNVTNSSKSADGGAIYSTGIGELYNVVITDAIAYTDKGDIKGGAIYYKGSEMINVTVTGSRASTDNGTSCGGAVYWDGTGTVYLYNSSFEENHADLGGGLYTIRTTNIYDTSFIGNVAEDGGAVYATKNDVIFTNASFEHNSAKRGGAIFTDNVQINMYDSTLRNNTAEQSGAALYHNYVNAQRTSEITNTQMINNTAFKGSAIYATNFKNFDLKDVVLLDNQANSDKFLDKTIGVYDMDNNYTSAVFTGNDNLLNSIWLESNIVNLYCDNVTYLGTVGITSFTGTPNRSNREVRQNITVYMFNKKGELVNQSDLVTDGDGKVTFVFKAEKGEVYNFAYEHKADRYYTYLRDTYSNSSLVQIWVNNCTYGENATALISLSDGAWGNLTGNVTVELNDTNHTTFTVEITNSTLVYHNITGLPVGIYNATATFAGNLTRLGDTDWTIFEVRPAFDLKITKDVNVTSDTVIVYDVIKYTINVTNKGPSISWNVNVTEVLSPYLKLISGNASKGYYNYTNGTWFIGNLDVNENVNLTIIAKVIKNAVISNTVWVEGEGRELNFTDNVASARNLTALSLVDLVIHKESNTTGPVNVTDKIKFTITVTNKGPCNASGVYVREALDSHLRLISYNATIGDYIDKYTWVIGNLTAGEVHNLTIIAEVISSGNISNAVMINSTDNDTNKSNNNDSIKNITALDIVDLKITKEVNIKNTTVNVGDTIIFTITVKNNGPCDAHGVNVTEVLSPHLKMKDNKTWMGYYNVTDGVWYIGNLSNQSWVQLDIYAEVISAGTISNVVVVNSTENDTNYTNNRDNITNITALPVVDLAITKEVNVTGTVEIMDKIKFTITVKNNGPCNATEVYVDEVLSTYLTLLSNTTTVGKYDGKKWTIGNLTNGTNATLTIIAQVAKYGIIENAVLVSGHENDTNYTNNKDNITPINVTAPWDLGINKTVNVTSGFVNVTDLIKFTVFAYNNGPGNATGVYVEEPLDYHLELVSYNATKGEYKDRFTWDIGNLNSGENATLTIVARVILPGSIGNAVVIHGYGNDTNSSNNNDSIKNITALPIVDLQITKESNVSSEMLWGDRIKFTITVKNNGPCDATGVWVSERLDSTLSMESYDMINGTSYNGREWIIGNLANQSSAILTIIAKATSLGVITNNVTVYSFENDTNKTNDNDNITPVKVLPIVDLAINKTVNSTKVNVTDYIKYTITVVNNGPFDATGVNVTEKLSDLLKVAPDGVNASRGSYDGRLWVVGDLANQSSATLTIIAKVIANGTIENVVTVTCNENDTNKSNDNYTCENVTALPVVDLSINKTVNVTVVNVTDYIKYTITVVNNGPCDATGVNVTEILSNLLEIAPDGVNASRGSYDGRLWVVGDLANQSSATLTIIAKVIANGTIENVVTVTCNENDTNKSNNEYPCENVTALPVVDLSITKTVNVTVVNVTDYIRYTITVLNDGPCNATEVVAYDKLDSRLEFVSFSSSRAGITYDAKTGKFVVGDVYVNETIVLSIVARVMAVGEIPNAANITGKENDTDMSNNNDSSKNVTSLPIVDVKVNKTVDVTEAYVGSSISYTIKVQNNGPCDASDVNVTEKLSDKVSFVKYNASTGNYDATKNIWYIGNLSNGSIVTLTLTVQIRDAGIIENYVAVMAKEYDTNLTNNNCTCDNVTALKLDTPIDLNAYDITYGEDEILTVRLPSNATGTVNITVGGRQYNDVAINNGIVELPVIDLAGGNYTVNVTYGGDGRYLPNSTSGKFKVLPVTPVITIEVEDIWVWEIEVLNVTVNAPGSVFVTVYGITVEIPLDNGVVTTDVLAAGSKLAYKGNATWNIIHLPVGTYPAFAYYPGNENYTSVSTNDTFHVRDLIPTAVVVAADDIYVGEDAVITIDVGPAGVTGNVTVDVDGAIYVVPLENGHAVLVVPDLAAGEKNVTVWYNGNELYYPSENSTVFNVLKLKPPVDIEAPEITVGEDGVITVTVPDDATGTITIEIEGKRYTAPVEDGQAVFYIPGLKVGVHDITAFYSGDDKYLPANSTGEIKVNPKEEPIHHNDTPKKSTIENKMHETGNPIMALIAVLISICLVQVRRFKK